VTGAPIRARTTSAAATRDLAAAVAGALAPGDLLLLVGDLGSGKTTFTQGLALGLGVTDPVTSPTFTLVRAYRCRPGPVRTLLHADLYRLDRLQDVVDLGIGEMVDDQSVAVVEWGDVAAELFGPEVLTVTLTAPPSVAGPLNPGHLAAGSPDAAPADAGPADAVPADAERIVTLTTGGAWAARRPSLAAALQPWTVPVRTGA
jgi:tRNA threonylcarbamoyladenosine biosynthesis protein TsaE